MRAKGEAGAWLRDKLVVLQKSRTDSPCTWIQRARGVRRSKLVPPPPPHTYPGHPLASTGTMSVTPSDGPPIQLAYDTIRTLTSYGITVAGLAWNATLLALSTSYSVLAWVFNLLSVILAPFLFVISPLLFGIRLVFDTLVRAPYNVVVAASEQLEEVWAVIGLALLVGLALGLLSRGFSKGLTSTIIQLQDSASRYATQGPVVYEADTRSHEDLPVSPRGPESPATAVRPRGRVKRVEWRRL
jgi:hypothetical protein